jgi:hypothetical protein
MKIDKATTSNLVSRQSSETSVVCVDAESHGQRVRTGSTQSYGCATGQKTTATSTQPVFVVGCPRSGTTLLYHMLLSSGAFAGYPFESDTFRILGPKFPNLKSLKSRRSLLEFWLQSENGTQSGLTRSDVEQRVFVECHNIGDFLRIVMEEMCRKQGRPRWAEKTPDHTLYLHQIKKFIPDALIVHIVRDGRDAALSLANFGRIAPFVCGPASKLLSFGLYWKWMVRSARAAGQRIGRDYYELHYEQLVQNPRDTLARLGKVIGFDFDYDQILQSGVGSVRQPDTSFREQVSSEGFSPVNRWMRQCSAHELAIFEALVGDCLEETGYKLATGPRYMRRMLAVSATSLFYTSQLELKHWLKSHTALGRFAGWKR